MNDQDHPQGETVVPPGQVAVVTEYLRSMLFNAVSTDIRIYASGHSIPKPHASTFRQVDVRLFGEGSHTFLVATGMHRHYTIENTQGRPQLWAIESPDWFDRLWWWLRKKPAPEPTRSNVTNRFAAEILGPSH